MARQIVPDSTDTQCGFKFFSGPLAQAAPRPLRTAGFAFGIELLANCAQAGHADGEADRSEPAVSWAMSRLRRAVTKRALVTKMCYNGWAIYPRVFHTTPR